MANVYRSVLAGAAQTGGDALPADVLSGKTFTNDNGSQTGTMTNNGAVSGSATPSQPYTIPAGYHNGNGIVSASIGTVYNAVTIADVLSQSQSEAPNTITCEVGDLLIGTVIGSPTTPTGATDVTSEYSPTMHGNASALAIKIYKATATSVVFQTQATGNAYSAIFRIAAK